MGEKSVIDANIDINYSSIFVFEKHNGDEDRLQFRYDYSEKFGANRIYSILHWPTLCMYPNLPPMISQQQNRITNALRGKDKDSYSVIRRRT